MLRYLIPAAFVPLFLLTACNGGRSETPSAIVLENRADELVVLSGMVMQAGNPVAGAQVLAMGAEQFSTTTNKSGSFELSLPQGDYSVKASATCFGESATDVALSQTSELNFELPQIALQAPGKATDLHGNEGPGPAQATIAWSAPSESGSGQVTRYRIYRDGEEFTTLGNTLAFGDTGASGTHRYAVSAINECGLEGEKTEEVAVAAMAGVLIEAPVSAATEAQVRTYNYPVLDANGKLLGERNWRTVTGLGNCCETFVGSSASGRLYEYGGTFLFYSDDEGETWSKVSNVLPVINAEGAVVGAPGGDLLAVNWDAYTGDELFTHKYVAATDTWYTARTPLAHQPLFDRPWVAVMEGPFTVNGQEIPYVSFLMSNYIHGDIMLMSLDGLHYQLPTMREFAEGTVSISLPLPKDPDRDWTHALRHASMSNIDGGIGLRDRSLTQGCDQAVLTRSLDWSCPEWPDLGDEAPKDNEVLRVDSDGNLHIVTVTAGDNSIAYRLSTDAGKSWKKRQIALPKRLTLEDWDMQANAELDQAVIVVHARAPSETAEPGLNQDLVIRMIDFQGDFRHKETMLVGNGNHIFGYGVDSTYDRFDYTTIALLPSGRVAISFGDAAHAPPGIAIEMAE